MARFFVQRVFKSRTWSRTESPNVRARQTGSRRAGCPSQYAKGALEAVWGLALEEGRRVEWGGRSRQSLRAVCGSGDGRACTCSSPSERFGRALRHMGGAGHANHCHQTELALSRSLSGGEGQAPNATPAASRSIGSSVWKDEASLAFALGLSPWSAWSSKPRENAGKAHKRLNTTNPPSGAGKFEYACIVHLSRQLTIGYCSYDWCCV